MKGQGKFGLCFN